MDFEKFKNMFPKEPNLDFMIFKETIDENHRLVNMFGDRARIAVIGDDENKNRSLRDYLVEKFCDDIVCVVNNRNHWEIKLKNGASIKTVRLYEGVRGHKFTGLYIDSEFDYEENIDMLNCVLLPCCFHMIRSNVEEF